MIFLLELFKLAMKRKKSSDDYFSFQAFQAERVIARVKNLLNIGPNASVIDYGCGHGGYAYILAKKFKDVLAIDYCVDLVDKRVKKFVNPTFWKADLLTCEIEQKKDFIFCASVRPELSRWTDRFQAAFHK